MFVDFVKTYSIIIIIKCICTPLFSAEATVTKGLIDEKMSEGEWTLLSPLGVFINVIDICFKIIK